MQYERLGKPDRETESALRSIQLTAQPNDREQLMYALGRASASSKGFSARVLNTMLASLVAGVALGLLVGSHGAAERTTPEQVVSHDPSPSGKGPRSGETLQGFNLGPGTATGDWQDSEEFLAMVGEGKVMWAGMTPELIRDVPYSDQLGATGATDMEMNGTVPACVWSFRLP